MFQKKNLTLRTTLKHNGNCIIVHDTNRTSNLIIIQMKALIPIVLSLSVVGCTTGSKTKTNINYYSNVSYAPPAQEYVVQRVVVERPVYYTNRDATMADLSREIGRKMLRKIRAAYNET